MTENERVKELRKALDLTLEKFGGQIGVGKSAISKIERAETSVTDQTRRSICREFGVSETWLRAGEGEMFVKRADADELAATVNRLLIGESAEFKRRLINALSTLKDEQWLLLEQKLKEIVGVWEAVPAFAPAPDKSDERELARQILQDKKAKDDSSVSSGADGNEKMA